MCAVRLEENKVKGWVQAKQRLPMGTVRLQENKFRG